MGLFPGIGAPLQFALCTDDYRETVYLSRTPVDWYDAVQAYIRACDEISCFVRPPFPEAAYEPVFCTWYAVLKDVTAEWTERAAAIAADLGFRTLILDDGWFAADAQGFGYRYAGDWVPAPSRFPDMAGHIRRIQAMGLKYILWVAPFMVGRASHAAQSMAAHVIPDGQPGFATGMGIQNLCPCNPEAREHIQGTLLALMGDYPLDGFKLDFIDAVGTTPCKAGHPHDFDAPGRAMHAALRGVYGALRSQNPDVLVEFRQTYANLALRDCATMYRGFDVPFDFDANRWNITMTRAVAGGVPVHADPVYWQTDELDENVARHMMTAMFAVPTVSVDFERLPAAHLRILKAWLGFYQEHKRVLAHGQFRPWMVAGSIPMLLLRHETTAVLGIFADALPPVALPSEITELFVLNAANETCVRLWVEGVEGMFAGLTFDLWHQPVEQLAPRALGALSCEIPIGGYVRFTRVKEAS
jgi:alpha-galactosidase